MASSFLLLSCATHSQPIEDHSVPPAPCPEVLLTIPEKPSKLDDSIGIPRPINLVQQTATSHFLDAIREYIRIGSDNYVRAQQAHDYCVRVNNALKAGQ